jgi:uncharacterized protein affecting Mg2+/Co2+ transport
MKKITALLLLAFLVFPAISDDEVRKFTDTTGREIQAEIMAVQGDQVQMNVGGKAFTLPISKFSEPDVAFIKQWAEANPAPVKIRGLYVEFEKNMERVKEPEPAKDAKKKTGPEQKRMSFDYTITVRNSSDQDLENLKLKYTIYKLVRERTGSDTTESIEETEGEDAIGTLKKVTDHTVSTDAVVATDSEGGGKKDAPKTSHSESVLGVVAKVYSGEEEVRSESNPDGLEERIKAMKEKSE